MENKQSALEWLKNQTLEGTIDKKEKVIYLKLPIDVFKQAKEMEKEQIITAFIDGEHQQGFQDEPKQYYEETYEKTI
jgi:hypothetical protein